MRYVSAMFAYQDEAASGTKTTSNFFNRRKIDEFNIVAEILAIKAGGTT